MKKRSADFPYDRDMKLIAHRGMHSDIDRENSAEAIENVLASVADGIEIDVRLSDDGVLVVHHDTRTASGQIISRTSFSDIVAEHPHVIRLETALEILQGYEGLINIEVKHYLGERDANKGPACVEKLVNVLGDDEIENITVSSFSPRNIAHVKKIAPVIDRSFLVPAYIPIYVADHVAQRLECSALHVSMGHMQFPGVRSVIKRAHRRDMEVRVHTVNSSDQVQRLHERGVDAVFTDKVADLYSEGPS
jgi:glycerophosphoryl diester phosphodiesterase